MFDNKTDFVKWMGDHGIDTSRFGQGEAKTVQHLLDEVCYRKCTLGLTNGAAVRQVVNTWIKLRHGYKILTEKQQLFVEDGRKRLRRDGNRNLVITAKNEEGEAWDDAALRALRDKLKLRPEQVTLSGVDSVEIKYRTDESPSFPGIATMYRETHCDAKLLPTRLSSEEKLELGLGGHEEKDFTTVETRRRGEKQEQIRHFWSWESAAVWHMLGDEDTEQHQARGPADGKLIYLHPKLIAHLGSLGMTPQEVRTLDEKMCQGLMRMWPHSIVEVNLLFGGRSGSLVLDATVRNQNGGVSQVCVIKVDRRKDLEEEVEQTKNVLRFLGENAPNILCNSDPPIFEKLGVTINMGLRTDTSEIGLLAIELVGAAWVSPEFSRLGSKLMCTFEELFKWEVSILEATAGPSPERRVFGEVPTVLSDIFSASGILTTLARRTAKRSIGNTWFDEIAHKLARRLYESTSVTPNNPIPWSESDWFEQGGEASHTAKQELEKFIERLSSPPEWLSQSGTLISLIHGDFHGGNLLVDLKGTPWVIDYGEVREGPCVFDIARLTAGVLFE